MRGWLFGLGIHCCSSDKLALNGLTDQIQINGKEVNKENLGQLQTQYKWKYLCQILKSVNQSCNLGQVTCVTTFIQQDTFISLRFLLQNDVQVSQSSTNSSLARLHASDVKISCKKSQHYKGSAKSFRLHYFLWLQPMTQNLWLRKNLRYQLEQFKFRILSSRSQTSCIYSSHCWTAVKFICSFWNVKPHWILQTFSIIPPEDQECKNDSGSETTWHCVRPAAVHLQALKPFLWQYQPFLTWHC